MKDKLRLLRANITSNHNWKWFILCTVLLGASMSALDVSIVNVAMPTLNSTFKVSVSVIEWVAIAYTLSLTVFLPLFGKLADMYGRSRLYNIGFIVFSAGSLFCGLSPSVGYMIVSRIIQAIGAGLLQANSVALITHAFPSSERGKAIGIQGAVQAVSMSVGPFVGGILIATVGWRAIFLINIPIGILGTVAALFILPPDQQIKEKQKVDYAGAALFASGLALLMLAFNEVVGLGWSSHIIILYFVSGLSLLCLFVITELKVENPLINLSLFRHPTFIIGNLTGLLSYFVLFAVLFLMPFYFERVLGFSTAITGSLLTPIPLAMTIVAPLAGHISDKRGPRMMTTLGMIVCALSCLSLVFVEQSTRMPLLIIDLIFLGVGMGLFTPPNNSAIMGAAPKDKLGVAGGILNMMRSLGLIFGVNISGLILISMEHRYLTEKGYPGVEHIFSNSSLPLLIKDNAFIHGFISVMGVLVLINLISAFFAATNKNWVVLVQKQAAQQKKMDMWTAQWGSDKHKAPAEDRSYKKLTDREHWVLKLLAEGCSNKEIASSLNVSVKTVASHQTHISKKLGVHSRAALVKLAVEKGIIKLEK